MYPALATSKRTVHQNIEYTRVLYQYVCIGSSTWGYVQFNDSVHLSIQLDELDAQITRLSLHGIMRSILDYLYLV